MYSTEENKDQIRKQKKDGVTIWSLSFLNKDNEVGAGELGLHQRVRGRNWVSPCEGGGQLAPS